MRWRMWVLQICHFFMCLYYSFLRALAGARGWCSFLEHSAMLCYAVCVTACCTPWRMWVLRRSFVYFFVLCVYYSFLRALAHVGALVVRGS